MPTPVYIIAGQSNAYSLNGGNGGASVAGKYAALTGSTDVHVASVESAGAPLTWGRDSPDWYSPGELFDQLVATILDQLSQPDTYLASVIWVQGEGDTWSFSRATEYAARLTALVNRLETALSGHDTQTHAFRFSVLSLSAHCPASAQQQNWATIRDQQLGLYHPRIDVVDVDRAAAAAHQNSADFYQSDGLHYGSQANDTVLKALMDRTPLALDGTMANDRLSGMSGDDTLRGGDGNDQLSGAAGRDSLRAWTGNDRVYGGTGDDTLTGDTGADQLYGGWGADSFVFCSVADSGPIQTTADTIGDFTSGRDVIDLTRIDANPNAPGDQAFRYLGAAAFDGQAGALRVAVFGGDMIVLLDTNGDRIADSVLFLTNVSALTASDFLL